MRTTFTIPKNTEKLTSTEEKAILTCGSRIICFQDCFLNSKIVKQIYRNLKNNFAIDKFELINCVFTSYLSFYFFVSNFNITHIRKIELRDNKIADYPTLDYSNLIYSTEYLVEFTLRSSLQVVIPSLANAIVFNSTLTKLKLENLQIWGTVDAKCLANILAINTTPYEVDLTGLQFHWHGEAQMRGENIEVLIKMIARVISAGLTQCKELRVLVLREFSIPIKPELRDTVLNVLLEAASKGNFHQILVGPCSQQLQEKARFLSFPEENAAAFLMAEKSPDSTVYRAYCAQKDLCDYKNLTKLILQFSGYQKREAKSEAKPPPENTSQSSRKCIIS